MRSRCARSARRSASRRARCGLSPPARTRSAWVNDLADEAVEAVVSALVAAVRDGRLAEERLVEAAGRVGRVPVSPERTASDRSVGLEAARRALRVEADPRLVPPALVVELRPDPLQAAGEVGEGLGDFVAGAEVVR